MLGDLPLIGGLANGLQGRGSVRLFADGEVYTEGAIGVLIGGAVKVSTVVSQGCRPIGPTHGRHRGRGEPAAGARRASRPWPGWRTSSATLDEDDRELVASGLQIGIAMDEYAERHERGDFLIRGVIGIDPEREAVAIGDVVEIGRTVRFQVRDAATADEDLYDLLDAHREELGRVDGALLFSCNGRGSAMFGTADHDAGRAARHARAHRRGGLLRRRRGRARSPATTTCTASPPPCSSSPRSGVGGRHVILAIDVGGTKMAAGLVGRRRHRGHRRTPRRHPAGRGRRDPVADAHRPDRPAAPAPWPGWGSAAAAR